MLPQAWVKDYDRRRLRIVVALLFIALAVPTGLVIWQAWSRLEWESFHQYRKQAEELTARIDAELAQHIGIAEARGFADYSFLNVSGDPGAGFLQRSALSAFPVAQDFPAVIGYFQVDADGALSTPLLPDSGTDPEEVGIGGEEYQARLALTETIHRILADNRLVGGTRLAAADGARGDEALAEPAADADALPPPIVGQAGEEAEAEAAIEAEARQEVDATYSQQVFDQLNQATRQPAAPADGRTANERLGGSGQERPARYGKLQDLQLDDALDKKSEGLAEKPGAVEEREFAAKSQSAGAERSRRVEQASLLAATGPSALVEGREQAGMQERRITTFESEVDPYQFSLLDSGHFVLFRQVWRDGERYIQGFLVEPVAFLSGAFESAYRATALAAMSNLVIAYRDDVIRVLPATDYDRGVPDASGMQGALLYRSRLSAPLDSLELIFTVSRLPPGPGAAVLGWATLLLAAVFLGGFSAIYRLGLGQIRLARQQQDFVSAVSHELKTPLTSIRMYGEMLREGWVEEDRRQQYYEYIHDESERLTRLISNVLQLASITRNEPQLDLQPITAGDVMDHVRSKIASQVERAGFTLGFDSDEALRQERVRVDLDCFTQIVINLVDNAIKFSKNGAVREIEFRATAGSDGRVRFSVRDHGPGVARDQMKKIFRLFYRSESELTRETVGTGIGLAIVHQLATAMSGIVDVANRNPGAEFGVSFPIIRQ